MSDAHVFTLTRPLTRSEMHSHALATLTHKNTLTQKGCFSPLGLLVLRDDNVDAPRREHERRGEHHLAHDGRRRLEVPEDDGHREEVVVPVSYTHLTLPTILLV